MRKPYVKELVIVEGKYDKIKLENLIDALIITTEGFQVFCDSEKKDFIKSYASKNGALVITDSDSAGFLIRKYLNDILSDDRVANIYIPDIYGKEKRKSSYSKEGKLGLEGIDDSIILSLLNDFISDKNLSVSEDITSYTLYELGLSGGRNSSEVYRSVLKYFGLPTRLSKNAFLKIVNKRYTLNEFKNEIREFCK